MRRIIRALPALALGALFGLMAAFVIAALAAPFLTRRVANNTALLDLRGIVTVLGVMGGVLGLLAGATSAVGGALLRRPGDPLPRKRPARISSVALLGGAIGGPLGALTAPVLSALIGRYDAAEGHILFAPGRFLLLVVIVGIVSGVAAAGFVVAFAPSVAPVKRVVRVRVEHLYGGPVTNTNDLAVLLNRIKEGGEDALAAGKEFHLS